MKTAGDANECSCEEKDGCWPVTNNCCCDTLYKCDCGMISSVEVDGSDGSSMCYRQAITVK